MHALGIQSLAVGQVEQRQQDISSHLGGTGAASDTKAVAAAGNFDVEATFDLSQVFIKLTTQIGQAIVIGGLKDNIPKNPNSIQDLYSKPLCK